jgi:hypothetical protein
VLEDLGDDEPVFETEKGIAACLAMQDSWSLKSGMADGYFSSPVEAKDPI